MSHDMPRRHLSQLGGFGGAVVVLTRAGEERPAAERISRDCAGSVVVLP